MIKGIEAIPKPHPGGGVRDSTGPMPSYIAASSHIRRPCNWDKKIGQRGRRYGEINIVCYLYDICLFFLLLLQLRIQVTLNIRIFTYFM